MRRKRSLHLILLSLVPTQPNVVVVTMKATLAEILHIILSHVVLITHRIIGLNAPPP